LLLNPSSEDYSLIEQVSQFFDLRRYVLLYLRSDRRASNRSIDHVVNMFHDLVNLFSTIVVIFSWLASPFATTF